MTLEMIIAAIMVCIVAMCPQMIHIPVQATDVSYESSDTEPDLPMDAATPQPEPQAPAPEATDVSYESSDTEPSQPEPQAPAPEESESTEEARGSASPAHVITTTFVVPEGFFPPEELHDGNRITYTYTPKSLETGVTGTELRTNSRLFPRPFTDVFDRDGILIGCYYDDDPDSIIDFIHNVVLNRRTGKVTHRTDVTTHGPSASNGREKSP